MSKVVGFVGLGLLGSALVERLQRGGYTVHGYDIEPQARERFRAAGGMMAANLVDVVLPSAPLVLCLPDSDVVQQVVDKLEAALPPRAMVIDTTTGDPKQTVQVAARLAERQIDYLDATVVGSSDQARRGQISLLVGGSTSAVERCGELFAHWTDRVFPTGPSGSGAQMKLVVNLALGLNRAVLAESLALAEACGIDKSLALDVLKSGAAYSAAMDSKGAKMVAEDFRPPQARLTQHLKDVRLIRLLADRQGCQLPLSDTHQQLLERAVERGFGDADNSAVIMAYPAAASRFSQ